MLQCVAVCCSVLQCVAAPLVKALTTVHVFARLPVVCCGVLQRVAVCCSVLQCVAVCYSVLQCVAVCCSVLQCVAACCSVLRSRIKARATVHMFARLPVVCCNSLQCVVVCCVQCVAALVFARSAV